MKRETIGIVGGGQLGRMLTLAALPMGFRVVVIDPNKNSPAKQVGAEEITASLYDKKALKKLAEIADYITIEIEHLDTLTLEQLSSSGKNISPSPKTIKLIQDKLAQKKFLRENKIPIADFSAITGLRSALETWQKFEGRMLIKTRFGAYDGRGNSVVKTDLDIKSAVNKYGASQLYAEQMIDFKKELAVMVAKDLSGNILTYPLVETIHERNICQQVLAPAHVSQQVFQSAIKAAEGVTKLLEGAGVYGIEMFLDKKDQVLINEIAPRVHNSGHYTIEANRTSQFEQHIRAITGLPFGDTTMLVPAAVMINILGERNGPTRLKGLNKALSYNGSSVHIYGKSPTKIDRKMGHITLTADQLEQALSLAKKARQAIDI